MTEVVAVKEVIEKVQEKTKLDDLTYKKIKDPYGFIYITTNLVNGKRYIGQRKFSYGWQTYLGSGKLIRKQFKNMERKILEKILFIFAIRKMN